MKFFLNTKFIEHEKLVDLVSIGLVAEDGRELYIINWDCDFSKASDHVKEKELIHLPFMPLNQPKRGEIWQSKSDIKNAIVDFTGCDFKGFDKSPAYVLKDGFSKPEFWSYYGSYHFFVFCQIFGSMMNLPQGLPKHINDVKQWCNQLGNPTLPKHGSNRHALEDARWVKQAWEFLRTYEEDCVVERG